MRERQFRAVHIGMVTCFKNVNGWHFAVPRYVVGDSLWKKHQQRF
ncbi:hypothetical protein H254_4287 [Klebsiella pneumoniae KP-11]|nr:hypothetical protein H254_4287 [Klebsiella pneumoniae KP-11]